MSIHTLHIEHVMLLMVYTLLTVANSFLYSDVKGTQWFSLYNVLALMGAIAVALRGQIPDFLSIVWGTSLVLAAYFALFVSLSSLFGRYRSQLYLQVCLVFVGIGTMLQYGYFQPNTKVRLVAYSVILAIQQAQIAWLVFRKQASNLQKEGAPLGLMLAALSLVNLVRVMVLTLHGTPTDYLQAGNFLASIIVANTCLQCGAVVSYIWLTAALLRRELQKQASTDPLTGLLNRRAIETAADVAIHSCREAKLALSAITIDLDGFKQVNDSFGHTGGDAILIAVANCLQQGMRRSDLLARTGGDEFVILLPMTSGLIAMDIADTLRRSIEALDIPCGEVKTRVTASFGLAQVECTSDWEELLTECDKALYAVKKAGGNQIRSHLRVENEPVEYVGSSASPAADLL